MTKLPTNQMLHVNMPTQVRDVETIDNYLRVLAHAYNSNEPSVTLSRYVVRAIYEIALQARREELSREQMIEHMAAVADDIS